MTKEITKNIDIDQTAIEKCLLDGDLKDLNPDQRLSYYKQVCETVGLNPLTKPFQYITLNGKLQMYALKGATDQLRKIHNINCKITNRENIEDIHTVTIEVKDRHGRIDEDIGFAKISGLKGDMLGNALSKAVTKAKRRATLSICGLGMLDETEIASIPDDKGDGRGKKEYDNNNNSKSDNLTKTLSAVGEEYKNNSPTETRLTLEDIINQINQKFATCEEGNVNQDVIDTLNEPYTDDIIFLSHFAQQYKENQEILNHHLQENQEEWQKLLSPSGWNELIAHITKLIQCFNYAEEGVAA